MSGWIQTLDNKDWFPHHPDPSKIDINVAATVLSRQARFSGHTKRYYSVAEHSLLVESLVSEPELKLPALLHDLHEAYTGFGDVASPVKTTDIKAIEVEIDSAVAQKFGFDQKLFYDPSVKRADELALYIEAQNLLGPPPIKWSQRTPEEIAKFQAFFSAIGTPTMTEAAGKFLLRFFQLKRKQDGNNND